jgi:hypothetical protein
LQILYPRRKFKTIKQIWKLISGKMTRKEPSKSCLSAFLGLPYYLGTMGGGIRFPLHK